MLKFFPNRGSSNDEILSVESKRGLVTWVSHMISLRRPTPELIRRFLLEQEKRELTYSAVGQTFGVPPQNYVVDHTRVKLGAGPSTFETAKAALRNWDQFRLAWLEAAPPQTPIEKGRTVAIVARSTGLWWLNACKIVAVVDESAAISRFGFAYGTLPHHAGTGEERFLIEWDHADDSVWFDILAFSRPRHILARIAYPFVRMTQKRFGRESSAAMQRAVHNNDRQLA